MIRVMIVDDEFLVRVGIKSILNWEEHGYAVVGEAASARDALAKLDTLKPDIILTDLMMDGMDGFDLIETCAKDHPGMRTIVLSSYNDFENVRRAMKLGASDYIFKLTVKPGELLKALEETCQGLEEKKQVQDNIVRKNISAIKQRLLVSGIQQSYLEPMEYMGEYRALGLSTDLRWDTIALVVGIDDYAALEKTEGFSQHDLLKYSMENIIQEVLGARHRAETYNYEQETLVALLQLPKDSAGPDYGKIREDFERLSEYMRRYLGLRISAGISEVFAGPDKLGQGVSQAQQALDMRFWEEPGGLYSYKEQTPPMGGELGRDTTGKAIGEIDSALRAADFSETRCLMKELFHRLGEQRERPVAACRRTVLHLYTVLAQHAFVAGVEIDTLQDRKGMPLHEGILRYDYLRSVRECVFDIFEQYLATRPGLLEKCREEILEVKRHVKRNLDGELNVDWAAGLVNMSKSYFSHVFKKEVGMSFVDYVNKARINRAEELLLTTRLRVGEVAAQVGIHNPNYFGILFKKLTGKSPGEYRAEIKELEE